jgi:hypothetical protein
VFSWLFTNPFTSGANRTNPDPVDLLGSSVTLLSRLLTLSMWFSELRGEDVCECEGRRAEPLGDLVEWDRGSLVTDVGLDVLEPAILYDRTFGKLLS